MGVGSASASSAGFGSFQPTLPVDRRDSLGSLSLWAARGTEEQTGPRADWEGTMQASGAIRWRPSFPPSRQCSPFGVATRTGGRGREDVDGGGQALRKGTGDPVYPAEGAPTDTQPWRTVVDGFMFNRPSGISPLLFFFRHHFDPRLRLAAKI